jgi:hypothetical protein
VVIFLSARRESILVSKYIGGNNLDQQNISGIDGTYRFMEKDVDHCNFYTRLPLG